jgi:hypothetical protein
MRPAQFGNWATQADLNADYDAAEPDVVLVTLGADDLQFVSIVEACIENGYEYAFDLADLACTSTNPGSTIQRDYFEFLPTLQANYATLVDLIADRAKAKGVTAPKVVSTNYANPAPRRRRQVPGHELALSRADRVPRQPRRRSERDHPRDRRRSGA